MDKLKDAFYKIYVGEAKAALRLKVYARKKNSINFSNPINIYGG
jgi:hypothetical protein